MPKGFTSGGKGSHGMTLLLATAQGAKQRWAGMSSVTQRTAIDGTPVPVPIITTVDMIRPPMSILTRVAAGTTNRRVAGAPLTLDIAIAGIMQLVLPPIRNSDGSIRHLWRAASGGMGGASERIFGSRGKTSFNCQCVSSEPSTSFLLL